jgi:hypothetical protein
MDDFRARGAGIEYSFFKSDLDGLAFLADSIPRDDRDDQHPSDAGYRSLGEAVFDESERTTAGGVATVLPPFVSIERSRR